MIQYFHEFQKRLLHPKTASTYYYMLAVTLLFKIYQELWSYKILTTMIY